MGEEAENELYRAEVYDDPCDEEETDCPIHGKCGGTDGDCPKC